MKVILRVLAVLLAAALLLYIGDYFSVRYRIPNNRQQTETVNVAQYYAVPQKNGKEEFLFDQAGAGTETCSESLFPQLGYRPCWYVKKHRQRRVDL